MEIESFVYESPAFKNFLRDHPHERGEVEFLESVTHQGMNVIDIGANIGIATVAIADKIGKRGSLYSFEPVPDYFNILKENLSLNKLKNVRAFQLALTDKFGRIDFYQKDLSSGITFEEGASKIEVFTTTIDRFLSNEGIEKVDLFNMDCEGSELLVLKGAEETLRRNKVKIFYEIHHNFLRQLGQSIEELVTYLQRLEFHVQSVCLNDLTMRNEYENCEYIYAHNLNEKRIGL